MNMRWTADVLCATSIARDGHVILVYAGGSIAYALSKGAPCGD
jgi:hypothetical protein